MSEIDATDLVCKSRRETLNEQESRRLEELVATNLTVRLMYLMGPEFERSGRVQRGDEAIAIRIAERALSQSSKGSSLSVRKVSWLLAAAILMGATGAAGAFWKAQADHMHAFQISTGTAPALIASHAASKHPRRAGSHASAAPSAADSVEPLPAASVPALEPVTSTIAERGYSRLVPRNSPTAAQLFSRANRQRREGRQAEALELYRTILSAHANSREASLARLALAKALSARQPQEALAHYRTLARDGGSLRAEALWGIVESAALVGQEPLRRQALADLLREFPESAYAAVARESSTDVAQ